MYLEILLLALLAEAPAHGYELKRRAASALGDTVAVNNNVLYPTLRRFEEAGAVSKRAEAQEGRPPRHVYTLTATGRELLRDQLSELPEQLADSETEFAVRVAFFDLLDPGERHAVLAARVAALDRRGERLADLRERAQGREWSVRLLDELLAETARRRAWVDELAAAAGTKR